MAIRRRRRRRKNGRKGHYITGTYTSTKTGEAYKYRSGWELQYMQYLDECDFVATWTYEAVVIPYISNLKTGKLRNYYPDFMITLSDGRSELVEIKPSKRVLQAAVQKKLRAAAGWCSANGVTLVVMTEVELKGLGLLKKK